MINKCSKQPTYQRYETLKWLTFHSFFTISFFNLHSSAIMSSGLAASAVRFQTVNKCKCTIKPVAEQSPVEVAHTNYVETQANEISWVILQLENNISPQAIQLSSYRMFFFSVYFAKGLPTSGHVAFKDPIPQTEKAHLSNKEPGKLQPRFRWQMSTGVATQKT